MKGNTMTTNTDTSTKPAYEIFYFDGCNQDYSVLELTEGFAVISFPSTPGSVRYLTHRELAFESYLTDEEGAAFLAENEALIDRATRGMEVALDWSTGNDNLKITEDAQDALDELEGIVSSKECNSFHAEINAETIGYGLVYEVTDGTPADLPRTAAGVVDREALVEKYIDTVATCTDASFITVTDSAIYDQIVRELQLRVEEGELTLAESGLTEDEAYAIDFGEDDDEDEDELD